MAVVAMEKERLELPPHSISQRDGLHGAMMQQKALNRGCLMSPHCLRSGSRSCYPVCGTQLRQQLPLHSPSYLPLPLDLATAWHSVFCPAPWHSRSDHQHQKHRSFQHVDVTELRSSNSRILYLSPTETEQSCSPLSSSLCISLILLSIQKAQ